MGIEPTLPAWEAGVLPLNYTREPDILNINILKRYSYRIKWQGLRTKNFLDRINQVFERHAIPSHERFNGLVWLGFRSTEYS